ncbi:unnamed protein product [Cylicostephanus goldi]|uniref:Uncharacterized protein n=1 Tax=Cylicostephanus goldi TaxID=71465 RepID=A0A3P6R809_CYLGO|nr:unnamed protein product [Cylicostephanus goldi]
MAAGVLCMTFLVLPSLVSCGCFSNLKDDSDRELKKAATFNKLNERLTKSFRKYQKVVDWVLVATMKIEEYLRLRKDFKPTLGYVYVIDRQKSHEHIDVLYDSLSIINKLENLCLNLISSVVTDDYYGHY